MLAVAQGVHKRNLMLCQPAASSAQLQPILLVLTSVRVA
jgi:hypothetical protein